MSTTQSNVMSVISFETQQQPESTMCCFAALASNVLFITLLLCYCINLDKSNITNLKKCLLLQSISQNIRILTIWQQLATI